MSGRPPPSQAKPSVVAHQEARVLLITMMERCGCCDHAARIMIGAVHDFNSLGMGGRHDQVVCAYRDAHIRAPVVDRENFARPGATASESGVVRLFAEYESFGFVLFVSGSRKRRRRASSDLWCSKLTARVS